MKFLSLATALSILSIVNCDTFFVTETNVVTVDAQGNTIYPSTSSVIAPSSSSSSSSSVETSSSAEPSSSSTVYQESSTYVAPSTTSLKSSSTSSAAASSSSASATGKKYNEKFNLLNIGDKKSSSSSSYSPTTLVTSSSSPAAAPSSTSTESTETTSSSSSDDDSDISQCDGIDESFASDILDAHNKKRTQHSVSELKWSKDAYEYASKYAAKYDCSGDLQHSGGSFGENLAVGYKTGDKAVTAWYDEGKNYDYSSASSFDHFTQVIWKGTTKVGCAYKDCSSENWGKYIVCSYDPAGNIVGEGKVNLLN